MKSVKMYNDYNKPAAKLDAVSTKLAHTRALLLVGSDADFSSYHPSVQHDFLGATLECVEDMDSILNELEEQI